MRMVRPGLGLISLALVIGVIVVGCANDSGTATRTSEVRETAGNKAQLPRGMGVLVGTVTMGPMSPVEGIGGLPGPVPVRGTTIVVSGLDRQETKSVVTDDRGVYRISLSAGSYRVEMAGLTGGRFTKDLPATVNITEAKETRLDIRIDTGIR